jgi:hypothetical protein
MDAEKNLQALYTFTLDGANADAEEKSTAPNITESLDYLIHTVDSACDEQEVRDAKLMLEIAIEAYVDEVTRRICRNCADSV